MLNFYQGQKKKETKQHETMRASDENSFTMITFQSNFSRVIRRPGTTALQRNS